MSTNTTKTFRGPCEGAHLHGVLVGEEVDDLQGVLHDASRHQLLTAVATLAHQGAAKALDDGALSSW